MINLMLTLNIISMCGIAVDINLLRSYGDDMNFRRNARTARLLRIPPYDSWYRSTIVQYIKCEQDGGFISENGDYAAWRIQRYHHNRQPWRERSKSYDSPK
jgi:hypothetical protein